MDDALSTRVRLGSEPAPRQTLRIALYARVSTTRQETENQTHVLREFSDKSGDTIVREYVEEVTGSGLKKRDEFAAMKVEQGIAMSADSDLRNRALRLAVDADRYQ